MNYTVHQEKIKIKHTIFKNSLKEGFEDFNSTQVWFSLQITTLPSYNAFYRKIFKLLTSHNFSETNPVIFQQLQKDHYLKSKWFAQGPWDKCPAQCLVHSQTITSPLFSPTTVKCKELIRQSSALFLPRHLTGHADSERNPISLKLSISSGRENPTTPKPEAIIQHTRKRIE